MTFAELRERFSENERADPDAFSTIRGEALHKPIYYEGRQWAVTAYGLECRDGTYAIAADRLWEEEAEYGWVLHMAEKNWVDVEDFIVALCLARVKHREKCPAGMHV